MPKRPVITNRCKKCGAMYPSNHYLLDNSCIICTSAHTMNKLRFLWTLTLKSQRERLVFVRQNLLVVLYLLDKEITRLCDKLA